MLLDREDEPDPLELALERQRAWIKGKLHDANVRVQDAEGLLLGAIQSVPVEVWWSASAVDALLRRVVADACEEYAWVRRGGRGRPRRRG